MTIWLAVRLNEQGSSDAAAIATGMDLPLIDASGSAVLVRANADDIAPTQSVGAAGAIEAPVEVGPDLGIHADGSPAGTGTAGAVSIDLIQIHGTALGVVQPRPGHRSSPGPSSPYTGAAW